MIISTLFDHVLQIETEQFIADWQAEEHGKSDGWTNDRIAEAKASSKLNYHIVRLTEAGLYQLALPAHSHPERIIASPETPLRDVLPMYVERHQKTLNCLRSHMKIMRECA